VGRVTLPPITQVAVAYGAGLWTGLFVSVPSWAIVVAGAVAVAARRQAWRAVLVVGVVMGLAAGTWQAGQRAASCAVRWEPGRMAAQLRVHDAPQRSGTTRATVLHSQPDCHGEVRVRLDVPVPAGAAVVAVGEVYGRGVFRIRHARVLDQPRLGRFRIREAIAGRIERLYGARAGLIQALVLGRRDDLSRELRRTFADAGLAHLLAISGLHVGILSSWLVLVLRWVGLGAVRWSLGAGCTWAYVALLGFPAPATRAAAFLTLFAVARWRQRHPPLSAVIGCATILIMVIDPNVVTSVGAWLSLAAVIGTAWGGRLARAYPRGGSVLRLFASSVGAVLFTSPITALVFGSVSPVGVIANLAAIPLAGVAVPGVFLSLAFGLTAGGAGLALAAIERVASLAAAVPAGHIAGIAGPAFALPWGLLLAVVLYLASGRATHLTRRVRHVLAVAATVAWAGVWVSGRDGLDHVGAVQVHVLDVGQGDAILVRAPDDRWFLVDAGPRSAQWDAGRRVVVPFLRRRGVRSLEAVLVSHGDADHLGGVSAVLEELDVGVVVEPGQPLGTKLYLDYLSAVDRYGLDLRIGRAGDTLILDSLSIAVLHPTSAWVTGEFEPNENSLVLHLRFGCFDLLLTGDIGHRAERELRTRVPDVDVLKIGHHGSAGSTSREWVTALRPTAAVVSVGRNTYGHPSEEVLGRLRASGARVYRTDRGGTVTISTDGRYYRVDQGRSFTVAGSLLCQIRRLLPSNGSFSSRSACIRRPPVISPTCSTTSPSPPK
jgi:competence protein ComEC